MAVVAGSIMGGLALAQGIFGAMGQSGQAKAQAMAQEVQQRQANFIQSMRTDAENRNRMRAFQANLERNLQIEAAATESRALAEFYLDRNFQNQKSTLSKQSNQVNAQFEATFAGRGISGTSGTARSLLRQNMESMGANLTAMKVNYKNTYRDIVNQQKGQLGQRQFATMDLVTFIPTTGGIADTSSSALTTGLISAGLSGIGAGYSAALQYGQGGKGGGGGTGGNGSDASLTPSQLAERQFLRGF